MSDKSVDYRELVQLMRDGMEQHMATEGPPPGEYERGLVDGWELAILVVRSAGGEDLSEVWRQFMYPDIT